MLASGDLLRRVPLFISIHMKKVFLVLLYSAVIHVFSGLKYFLYILANRGRLHSLTLMNTRVHSFYFIF